MCFYARLIRRAGITDSDHVLAVCAGEFDRAILESAGVKNATISNLTPHPPEQDTCSPYRWQSLDAELIALDALSVDWVCVHAGLHHCASPHKALCEMLRVARKGVLVVEARDSFLMRLGVRLGIAVDFELEPAALSNGYSGGYRNTGLPNYIYRWTEREVEKTVYSFDPSEEFTLSYDYGYRIPDGRIEMTRSWVKRVAMRLGFFAVAILKHLMPRQGNQFGFICKRTGKLRPWVRMSETGPTADMEYISLHLKSGMPKAWTKR